MSDKDEVCKTPNNEKIIADLTKDLEQHTIESSACGDHVVPTNLECNSSHNEASVCNNSSPGLGTNEHVPPDFEDSDTESETQNKRSVPDDFIDEAALTELETTLSLEEKESRKKEALRLKNIGNEEFRNGNYLESVKTYTETLRLCPPSYKSERSVFYANRAASKIKLERKQTAIDDCSAAIELNPVYVRALLRRAKLYEETEKLDESLEDYKKILEVDDGNSEARAALIRLPPLINERNEKLKTEMLGKLKDLGNLFLKPFGLSTENFKLNQDPNSGSYSVNFQQNN